MIKICGFLSKFLFIDNVNTHLPVPLNSDYPENSFSLKKKFMITIFQIFFSYKKICNILISMNSVQMIVNKEFFGLKTIITILLKKKMFFGGHGTLVYNNLCHS